MKAARPDVNTYHISIELNFVGLLKLEQSTPNIPKSSPALLEPEPLFRTFRTALPGAPGDSSGASGQSRTPRDDGKTPRGCGARADGSVDGALGGWSGTLRTG